MEEKKKWLGTQWDKENEKRKRSSKCWEVRARRRCEKKKKDVKKEGGKEKKNRK